jgi:hypothetical protein
LKCKVKIHKYSEKKIIYSPVDTLRLARGAPFLAGAAGALVPVGTDNTTDTSISNKDRNKHTGILILKKNLL